MYTFEVRQQAITFRKNGKSLREIARSVGATRGTISRWVRHIVLSEEQKNLLDMQNPCKNPSVRGNLRDINEARANTCRLRREESQSRGKEDALKNDAAHILLCALYWAEGTKDQNTMAFTNSDPVMMKTFIRILRRVFNVSNDRISIRCHCFTDVKSLDEIEDFWLNALELQRHCLRKSMVNMVSKASKGKRIQKSTWGTCKLMVHNTDLIQRIYGAIDQYASMF